MAVSWFDLSELGGKLERLRDEEGQFYVRLTTRAQVSQEALDAAGAHGWIGSEAEPGRAFSSYRRFDRLSEMVTALGVFFPEEAVTATKADVRKLVQSEVVLGYNDAAFDPHRRMMPSQEQVALDLQGLMTARREHILGRVAAAQKLAGAAVGADGAALFQNDGISVWRQLSDHFGVHDATSAMVSTLLVAQVRGERFDDAHRTLMQAAELGRGLPTFDTGISEMASVRVLPLRENFEAFGGTDPSWTEERFYRGFMLSVPAFYRAWDGVHVGFAQEREPPENFGYRFLADPGIPESWRHDTYHRTSAALRSVAGLLGVEPGSLFNGRRQMFHFGKGAGGSADGSTLGYHRTVSTIVGGERVKVTAIKFTPFAPGAAVHEIAHGIDLSHREAVSPALSAEMVERLIVETGIREFVVEAVGRSSWLSERYQKYLTMPTEIIARAVEAAVTDRALDVGDADFRGLGGVAMLNGGWDFQAPPELGERFVHALRGVMVEAREARLEAEAAELEPSSFSL